MNKDLTKEMIIVSMNDANITTEDRPIIGTYALATCLGVLLYSEEKKKAIVAHVVASNPIYTLDKIFNLLIKNKLLNTPIKYKIILGYYKDAIEHYNTIEILEKHFKDFIQYDGEIDINIDDTLGANAFAFDASTGRFVTSSIIKDTTNNFRNR